MIWQPRSLSQLMLIGFFVVVAPLSIAIFYTVQAFDALAVKTNGSAQQLVVLTRVNQQLQSDVWELERRAGQYAALGDANLLGLFELEHQTLLAQLQGLENLVDKERGFHLLPLRESLARARVAVLAPSDLYSAETVTRLFDETSSLTLKFRQASEAYVDSQLKQQVQVASDIKQRLMLMVFSLAAFTLVATLLFVYWINRPVRQLDECISQLGSGDLSQVITIDGPQEMQRLGESLDWLRSRLAELDEQKQQFLRHMSHELKTPLASLREGADLLSDGVMGSLNVNQQEIVSIMQQNSHELQRLIENLLDYNQVLNQARLALIGVDFAQLWHQVQAPYAMVLSRKSIQLDIQSGPMTWVADQAKLKTILDNLLSNAVSYCPDGGKVTIHWQVKDEVLQCFISNDGVAISAEEHSKIFEPFFQGKNSRNGAIKGSGIGLSVARECAFAHSGSLSLLSATDQHEQSLSYPVTFCLKLPRLISAEEPSATGVNA